MIFTICKMNWTIVWFLLSLTIIRISVKIIKIMKSTIFLKAFLIAIWLKINRISYKIKKIVFKIYSKYSWLQILVITQRKRFIFWIDSMIDFLMIKMDQGLQVDLKQLVAPHWKISNLNLIFLKIQNLIIHWY